MARLVLVDTADQLPGLLPLHAWSAVMSSDLIMLGAEDHPFRAHLENAELRVEIAAQVDEGAALSRTDLLAGMSPQAKRRAEAIVDRVRNEGQVAYLFGPGDEEPFTRVLGMEAARTGVEVEVVYFGVRPKGNRLLELVAVQERLRAPGGCPWDAEQTHASLARYAVEEVYELLEAIESGDRDALNEELGDVLLQVVLQSQIAEDEGTFTIDDVAGGIIDKLVRRHPHVFADMVAKDADSVMANWEQLKAAEKPERTGVFDGVPPAQPALQYVEKLQSRAAHAGFDWEADAEAAQRVALELEEFLAAGDDRTRAKEIGDLLMSVVGLARRHRIDTELALRGAAGRFRRRFERMVAEAGRPLNTLSRSEWLELWDAAKDAEQAGGEPAGD
ncbi:MAG: nucleoside triphosphate pyrophosphohydrolase [Nitriliruptorales bacterium]|nr:nucleoside triphosphate pyrophosphohydrolase [Nitriliruptorales bacterium]